MAKQQWKCIVCGYIHEGPEPPEVCLVCGAGRDQFIPLEAQPANLIHDLWHTFRLHAVMAHFPNGLVPALWVFLLLFWVTARPALAEAIFWLLLLIVLTVPVSLASGIYDWKTRYGGEKAPIFLKKIILAAVLFVAGCGALFLHLVHPELPAGGGVAAFLYLFCLAVMMACAVLLGHYGGKLVFHWKTRR